MKATDRKNTILRAATDCFAYKGYHNTSISDIIDKTGIARGTFYLYFKSKQDVFTEIIDTFISHLSDQIKTIDVEGNISVADQLKANVERVVDTILEKPAPAKIIFNEAVGLNSEIDSKLKSFYSWLTNRVETSLRKGIHLGLVREVNPHIAAATIIGGFRELLVQRTVFENNKVDRNSIIEGLTNVFVRGMANL